MFDVNRGTSLSALLTTNSGCSVKVTPGRAQEIGGATGKVPNDLVEHIRAAMANLKLSAATSLGASP